VTAQDFDGSAEARRLIEFGRAAVTDTGFGRLDRHGRLVDEPGTDLVITARMTFCYAVGTLLGWPGCADLAAHGVRSISGPFRDQRHGGYHQALPATGAAARKLAYPHAFVVLAAAAATAADIPGGRELLDEALAVLDRRFWSEPDQALIESWDEAFTAAEPYWGANANMHGVEALLAAYAQTGEPRWRDRALGIATTFVDRHARAAGWMLPEHYRADWTVDREYNADRPTDEFRPYGVTVGHLLEWSRLLLELRSAFPAPPGWLADAARSLYDTATAIGWQVDGQPGFVYTVDWTGRPVVRTRPHWVLAEAIAATASWRAVDQDPRFSDRLRVLIDYARRHLIDRDHGSWHHELDPDNRPGRTMWDGKPDLYHALQASLITELPLAPSLVARLRAAGHDQHDRTGGDVPERTTLEELLRRIEKLAADRDRVVIGIAGPPGAGKSTLAAVLTERLGERAALVGMDGFHLGQRQLERLGRAERKGAPDTFDALGYVALLRRIRERTDVDHFVPVFDRHLEEPIAAAGCVPRDVPVVITEGNYLLLDDPAWRDVAGQLDECWFVAPDPELRLQRLTRRHVEHGRSPEAAVEWVERVDEANARVIMRSAPRADLIIETWTD